MPDTWEVPNKWEQQPLLYDPSLLRAYYLYVCNMGVLVLSPGLKCKRGNACQSAVEGSKDTALNGICHPWPGSPREGLRALAHPRPGPSPRSVVPPSTDRACAVRFAKLSAPWELLVFYEEELRLCAPLQAGHKPASDSFAEMLRRLRLCNSLQQHLPNKPLDFYLCTYRRSKLEEFLVNSHDPYFYNTQRHRMVRQLPGESPAGALSGWSWPRILPGGGSDPGPPVFGKQKSAEHLHSLLGHGLPGALPGSTRVAPWPTTGTACFSGRGGDAQLSPPDPQLCFPEFPDATGTKLFMQGNLDLLYWKQLALRLDFMISFPVSSTICALDRPGFKFRLCGRLA
ncbi:uncharacterized protein RBU33_020191 [Hipposideros larvatus]